MLYTYELTPNLKTKSYRILCNGTEYVRSLARRTAKKIVDELNLLITNSNDRLNSGLSQSDQRTNCLQSLQNGAYAGISVIGSDSNNVGQSGTAPVLCVSEPTNNREFDRVDGISNDAVSQVQQMHIGSELVEKIRRLRQRSSSSQKIELQPSQSVQCSEFVLGEDILQILRDSGADSFLLRANQELGRINHGLVGANHGLVGANEGLVKLTVEACVLGLSLTGMPAGDVGCAVGKFFPRDKTTNALNSSEAQAIELDTINVKPLN